MILRAIVSRGGRTESYHDALAVAVRSDGYVLCAAGDPDFSVCVRSSLKPFQAAASVRAGAVDAANFIESELALMCASHNGEPVHVETARGMMAKLGLSEEVYECGAHLPIDRESREALHRAGLPATPFTSNCSGKHAGMLALALHLKADPRGYTRPDHPVQQTILAYVRSLAGIDDFPIATDGCSAPVPFLPLRTLATLYALLAARARPELDRVFQAMTHNPYLIGGNGRFDTAFITALGIGRAVSKVGGEAVQGVALRQPDGAAVGIAVKILDGAERARDPVTLAVLKHLRLLTTEEECALAPYASKSLSNHRGIEIGRITASVAEEQ